MDSAIRQPYAGDSLTLTPAAAPVNSSKAGDFPNPRPCGEGLNVGNFTLNLEAHRLIVSSSRGNVNGAKAYRAYLRGRLGHPGRFKVSPQIGGPIKRWWTCRRCS
jgi:hypothetical protein